MLVILVGFVYWGSKSGLPELIGNYADLYHLYNFFKTRTEQILVMTDFVSPENCPIFIDAVRQKFLSESLITFERALSWDERLIPYSGKESLEKLLEKESKEIFVYFSGHCSEGKLILPDSRIPSFDALYFRQKLERGNPGAEIFLVFDCCDADGTKLPFVLEDSTYTISKPSHFTSRKTLCLCSTSKGQDSASKIVGSVFTRCLLTHLHHLSGGEKMDLNTLVGGINEECACYPQTATLYSSFPNLKKIWPWIYLKKSEE